MSEFQAYLSLGFAHISDMQGYDHILFLVALCAIYRPTDWKKVLVLVTAFTIGHSVTLALSAFHIILISSEVVEFLIPITIFMTAIFNTFYEEGKRHQGGRVMFYNYFMALIFGFIHGMGFSNYFSALLGEEENIAFPLLSFNIGLELGQLMIVGIILLFAGLFLGILNVKQRSWNLFISGMAAGIALILMRETAFW